MIKLREDAGSVARLLFVPADDDLDRSLPHGCVGKRAQRLPLRVSCSYTRAR